MIAHARAALDDTDHRAARRSRWCRRGPYRFVSHPNYFVVAAEILVLPLVFGLVGFAILFTLLNAAMMIVRIRAEQSALAGPPAGTPRAL